MENSWVIRQDDFNPSSIAEHESIFSLGNGYLGFRGFLTERKSVYHPGVFLNGFYELFPIIYGEKAYGFPENNQKMIDVPDTRYLSISCGEEPVSLETGIVLSFHRCLDIRKGVLTREMRWESNKGDMLTVTWEHLISYRYAHIGCSRILITHSGQSPLTIESSIAPPSAKPVSLDDPRTGEGAGDAILLHVLSAEEQRGDYSVVQEQYRTARSGLVLMCGSACSVVSEGSAVQSAKGPGGYLRYSIPPSKEDIPGRNAGHSIEIEKLIFYRFSGIKYEDALFSGFQKDITMGLDLGYKGLLEAQEQELSAFWHSAGIEIDGDDAFQKALRFNMFQLYQSTGRNGVSSLCAKGLTGSGYEGHYFWDTEIYAMPFFTGTSPAIARKLLEYRISLLDSARERAAELSEKGALYPWRTINGQEASAYFPAGTAQYHINADIAYSLVQYVEITGDESIILEGGAELLFETARLWMSIGFFNPHRDGQFCIHEVTGPDEYSALVNNNFYTNSMAAYHLHKASEWYDLLQGKDRNAMQAVTVKIGLAEEEPVLWSKAADSMFLPYDTDLGIHLQDDAFLDRKPWDLDSIDPKTFPLLLHYHPLVIYRHRVIKQADTVLALLLLHGSYSRAQKIRDFDFYEQYTTGDSSLSACIQGILALELGYDRTGYRYARSAAFVDLENLQGNTRDGLHTASMAGSWMLLVYGLAGLRYCCGVPSFYPGRLPDGWKRYAFSLRPGCGILRVCITPDWTEYVYEGEDCGDSQEIRHRSRNYTVGHEPLRLPTGPVFRGAVFDLDGVITATDEFHFMAWKKMADEEGWEFTRAMNHRLRGVSRMDSLMIITRENGVVVSGEEAVRLTDRKNDYYRELLGSLTPDNLLPGVLDLINRLRDGGIPIALASASRNAGYILEKLGIAGLFDFVVPAGEIRYGKPHPDIFIAAAEGIGCLPDECVGVEDAQAGVEGIRAAGMKVVGLGPGVVAGDCDLHADSLQHVTYAQFPELFEDS